MKNSQLKSVRRMAALGAVALLACAGAAVAGEAGTAQKAAPVSGLQVHVDPATGQLRQPSAAEAKALADAVRKIFAARSATSAQAIRHSDGSVSASLGPDALNVWVVTVGPDGAMRQMCVEGANAAVAVQGAPAALEVK